jgi:hypothetical protein
LSLGAPDRNCFAAIREALIDADRRNKTNPYKDTGNAPSMGKGNSFRKI